MKAERRHELKENELLQALNNARKYLDENGKPLGIAAVVVVVVVAAVSFSMRSRAAAIEDVWRRRAQLTFEDPEVGRESLESLARMTESVTDKRFVLSSLMEQGQQALRLSALVEAPPDPDFNDKAAAAFRQLLERFSDNPLAFGVAEIGLATVEENEFVLDHDFAHKERADEHLGNIINNSSMNSMPFMRAAMDRRQRLDEIFTRIRFAEPEFEEPLSIEAVDIPVIPVDEAVDAPVDEAGLIEGAESADAPTPAEDAAPVNEAGTEQEESIGDTAPVDQAEPPPAEDGGAADDTGTP